MSVLFTDLPRGHRNRAKQRHYHNVPSILARHGGRRCCVGHSNRPSQPRIATSTSSLVHHWDHSLRILCPKSHQCRATFAGILAVSVELWTRPHYRAHILICMIIVYLQFFACSNVNFFTLFIDTATHCLLCYILSALPVSCCVSTGLRSMCERPSCGVSSCPMNGTLPSRTFTSCGLWWSVTFPSFHTYTCICLLNVKRFLVAELMKVKRRSTKYIDTMTRWWIRTRYPKL